MAIDWQNAESSFDQISLDDSMSAAPFAGTAPGTSTTEKPASARLTLVPTDQSSGSVSTVEPEAASPPISQAHALRLRERGLNPILCAQLGVHSVDEKTIGFHYYKGAEIWNTKLRRGKGNMPWAQKSRALIAYGVDDLREEVAPDEFGIIVEGEFDRIACIQAGLSRVVSVPNGAQAGDGGFTWLYQGDSLHPDFDKFRAWVIFTDADAPGLACRDALAVRLGDHRCRWVQPPADCKDANDVLRLHGAEALRELIENARPMWADEVATLDDIPDPGEEQRYRVGFTELDAHGFRVTLPALWTIVGPYGSGKSILLRQMLVQMWRLHGWRALLPAFEERVKPRFQRDLRRHLIGRGWTPDNNWTKDEIVAADAEINRGFRFLLRPKRKAFDPLYVLRRIEYAVKAHDCKVVVIDPMNEIELRPTGGQLKTDLMGDFLVALKELADDYGLLVIVCAHTTKNALADKARYKQMPILRLDDAEDTRYYGNKSDIGWAVWRKFNGPTFVHVDKLKDEETMGRRTLVELEHHRSMNSFSVKQIGYDILKQ